MSRKIVVPLLFFVLLAVLPAVAQASETNGGNICFTQPQYQCDEQIEWEIGYFWANHTPSPESCAHYHQHFDIGDIWGMCDGIDAGGAGAADTEPSPAQIERAFKLTSQWHAMPDDESSACPFEGLDPIIDYENNTYICGTSF